jgi:hypothetical protein
MTVDFEQPTGDDTGGGNRLFIILAIGLAGLIVLGLVAIGGVLILRNIRTQQSLAQATPPTPTLAIVEELPTSTSTHTPVPPPPTDTPTVTPTNTPVVLPTDTPTQEEAATGTASAPTPTETNTPVPVGTPAGDGGEVPDTGVGGFGLALIAVGLVGVLAISRRLRHVT